MLTRFKFFIYIYIYIYIYTYISYIYYIILYYIVLYYIIYTYICICTYIYFILTDFTSSILEYFAPCTRCFRNILSHLIYVLSDISKLLSKLFSFHRLFFICHCSRFTTFSVNISFNINQGTEGRCRRFLY